MGCVPLFRPPARAPDRRQGPRPPAPVNGTAPARGTFLWQRVAPAATQAPAPPASVAESVDAGDSKSPGFGLVGSSPTARTTRTAGRALPARCSAPSANRISLPVVG